MKFKCWRPCGGVGGGGLEESESISRYDHLSGRSINSGVLLPSLGAQSNRRLKLHCFIINPFDRRYRIWQAFLVVLVFYTAWVSPFEFGFLDSPNKALSITDNVVNGIFAIDIILTFFVAYLDKVTYLLIDNHKRIAWRYAKTWLVFDVISVVPSELPRSIFPSSFQSNYFNMLRLWRLRRVSAMFARLEKDRNFSYFWVRISKLICVTLFVVHFAACMFYHIAFHHKDHQRTWIALFDSNFHEETVWICYLTSLYWAITTITTVGYGDLHPVNSKEIAFDVFYMLFNMGLYSYLIGNMTNLVVHGTRRTREFRDTIQAASGFAQRNQLPVRLQDQMLAHLCLRYRTDSERLQQQEVIDLLPKAIRSSISHFLFYSLVDKVYLFRGVSTDILFQLVSEMKAEYFPPREDVILQNEAPTDMYILVTGAVDLITQKSGIEQVVGELSTGDVCGEIGMLCFRPQICTVRTKRLCQLLRLNRTTFLSVIQKNIQDGTVIMNNLLQNLKEQRDPMMEAILLDTENMLAQGRMEMPVSLCFAAMRGDDVLLHKLLRQGGLDANELDSSGRSALNVAASKGYLACVLLLLDYGADPNRRDSEGNIPLWDAMVGGHESVVKLLLDNGASISSGDVGQFASFAVEQDNVNLLKDIIKYGGDVTVLNPEGTTALHKAISEEKTEIVKFLIEQGADIDLPDVNGWTPRALANHQGHEQIMALFQSKSLTRNQTVDETPGLRGVCHLKKYQSEPKMMPFVPRESVTPKPSGTAWSNESRRRRANDFSNSLFGILSSANRMQNRGGIGIMPSPMDESLNTRNQVARVTISCPEKNDFSGKVIHLPKSLQELLEIGSQKFGFSPAKVLTNEGAVVEDIELIRDGDHLIIASDHGFQNHHSNET